MPADLLQRYFIKDGSHYQIVKSVRDRHFKLIDTDLGRSLFDITHSLRYPTLAQLALGQVARDLRKAGLGAAMSVWLPAIEDEHSRPERREAGNDAIAGLRILLVDDDRESAASLTTLLELMSASVVVATTASEALEVGPERAIDVVLSDISLPGIDG